MSNPTTPRGKAKPKRRGPDPNALIPLADSDLPPVNEIDLGSDDEEDRAHCQAGKAIYARQLAAQHTWLSEVQRLKRLLDIEVGFCLILSENIRDPDDTDSFDRYVQVTLSVQRLWREHRNAIKYWQRAKTSAEQFASFACEANLTL